MISIKKYLSTDSREASDAYERMSLTLLQAIGLHAVEGERADYDWLRCAIADLQTRLTEDPSPANILVTTGAAVKAMQDYNRRTSHILSARSVELRSIVGMLTGAMSQISTTSQTSIARLQDLQRQIEQAVMLEDVRTVKLRLSECLESMRGETERQRNESVKVVHELKQGLHGIQAPKQAEAGAGIDPLTGLPSRVEGEAAILAAGGPGLHAYAALFVLGRMQAIASRYGSELSDGVLMVLLQRLSLGLSPQDQFFRWGPDSFLAVLHRKESGDLLRREVTRLLSVRLEHSFEIASRSVTLPISPTWTIVPLFEFSQSEVLRKLDSFSATGRA